MDGGEIWMTDRAEAATLYKVVMNHEQQYSIWPVGRANALGWIDAGRTGSKTECLSYIEQVWTDMRPLSLRVRMGDAPGRS
jgi:MbtH protein